MQTIKGFIALLIVGFAVFFAILFYNNKTEPAYEAKMKRETLANRIEPAKQTVTAAAKAGVMKTNTVARQKIKNMNL